MLKTVDVLIGVTTDCRVCSSSSASPHVIVQKKLPGNY